MSDANSLNSRFQRILVITQRYLGDTLLVTPLIHSLRRAYPDSIIEVLLPESNKGILEGNPDIDRLLVFPKSTGWSGSINLLRSLFRRYDLAISMQNSDRTTLCAILASNYSLGFIDSDNCKSWWKKRLLTHSLLPGEEHTVLENLRFCQLLDIPADPTVIAPCCNDQQLSGPSAYAVLHIMPQWRFKQWHIDGWREVIRYLHQQQLEIILSGSNQAHELAFIQNLLAGMDLPVMNLAGRLSLGELSLLIQKARVFVGPDTGITHLAAATGTPTITLFGPTSPVKWAPWPKDYGQMFNPFTARGTQHVNNVWLLQDQQFRPCIPCQQEGCDKHRESTSACLDDLPVAQVIKALNEALYNAN